MMDVDADYSDIDAEVKQYLKASVHGVVATRALPTWVRAGILYAIFGIIDMAFYLMDNLVRLLGPVCRSPMII